MSQSRGFISILCLFLAYSSAQAWNFGIDIYERTVKEGEIPWMVNVLDNCGSFFGGGSLISNYAVLTAWKVVEDRNASQTKVHFGKLEYSSDPAALMGVRVRSIVRHPDFNETSGAYNLALLFLRNSVETTSTIRPINLATRTSIRNLDLNNCIAKGTHTLTLPLAVVQSGICQQELRRWLGPSFQLDDSLMCAGGGIGRNICDEDGYPLVCPLATDHTQFQQVGIVNWNVNCGQGATPDVYTNVVPLHDWIDQQIRLNPYVEGPANQDNEEQSQCEIYEGGMPPYYYQEQDGQITYNITEEYNRTEEQNII